jgi:hypothetical protein
MIVSINQPAYLPWLGYFHRIAVSDLHICLDHVQFEKNSFTNRNKIRSAQGWCWLTVPVKTKGQFKNLAIKTLPINNKSNWRKKHWQTIRQNYSKAPYFKAYAPFFEAVYQREWPYLFDLCHEINRYLLDILGIKTPLLFSSQMNPSGVKDELVLNLCQKANAQTYLSGILGQNYLRESLFEQAGIKVRYQRYRHPEYAQFRGQGFEPYMSVIDLLFNCGPRSLELLLSGQEPI